MTRWTTLVAAIALLSLASSGALIAGASPLRLDDTAIGQPPSADDPPTYGAVTAPEARPVSVEILADRNGQPLSSGVALAEPTEAERLAATVEDDAKAAAVDVSRINYRSRLAVTAEPGVAASARVALDAAASGLAAAGDSNAYLVIQFPDRHNEAARAALEAAGVTFFDYYKSYAFTAKAPPAAAALLDEMAASGQIRHADAVPAASRIEASLLERGVLSPTADIPIIFQFYEPATTAQLEAVGALMTIDEYTEGPINLVVGAVRGENVAALAELPFARWIEESALAKFDNLESVMASGADHATAFGYTGAGIRVAIMDSGIARSVTNTYHSDLPSGRILDQYDFFNDDTNASDDHSHGTHVAGTVGGSGVISPAFRGHAPGASLLIYKIGGAAGVDGDTFDNALERAAQNNANISSNSWSSGNGVYDTRSEWADHATRGNWDGSDGNPQYINVIAATSNDDALVAAPASGKNTIAVGALKDGNYQSGNLAWTTCTDTDWPPGSVVCFSNNGPLDIDGNGNTRVKPDLVAPGVRTFSTAPWYLYGDNRSYQYKDGTSMAAPAVAGDVAAALSYFDGSPGGDLRDWPEVVKAAFLATATYIDASTSHYGRGQSDVYHVIWEQGGVNDAHFWGDSLSSDGQVHTHTFTIPAGFAEVRAALVWNDPPGSTEGINDLDLRVYDAGGSLRGSATSFDDNVEYVKATTGGAGTWKFVVRAYDITQSPPQYYGLAVNVIEQGPSLSLSGSASDSSIEPGDSFYIESNLSNSGYTAGATWVGIDPPTGFTLTQTCVYPHVASRAFCYDDSASYFSSPWYKAATGQVIAGEPRMVRWHFQSSPGLTPGNRTFALNGGGKQVAAPANQNVVVFIEDVTPPSNPTSIWSTHITSTWSADTTVSVCWSGASDNYSGVPGYGLYWDHLPTSVPGAISDTNGACNTSAALATDNDWYLHVRAMDGAGNWASGATHIGPFYIDGSTPATPIITETHLSGVWTSHNTPYFSWGAVSDSGSGIHHYEYSLDGGGGVSIGNVTSHHPTFADGAHYYKLRAEDGVGHQSAWSNTIYRYVDTVAPSSAATSTLTSTESCFVVSWTGSDATSGIANYDLQYKDGGGAWTAWITATIGTNATFCGVATGGHTYYFRSRAHDYANNVEAYPSLADSQTHVPLDNRPASSVQPLAEYYRDTCPGSVSYQASDDQALGRVVLHRRYSSNNSSWSAYSPIATTTFVVSYTSYNGSFTNTCPSGEGYYQLYTIATDDSGQTETAPGSADAGFLYDATRPTNPAPPATESHGVVSGAWQMATNDPSFTWGAGSDDRSGIAGYWVWWGDGGVYTTGRSFDPGPVAEGTSNNFWVLAEDNAGNWAADWSLQFVFRYGAVPVANFSGTPLTSAAPRNVAFSDASSGTIVSRAWSFGDGGVSTDTNPTHLYANAGVYTVSLTATGPTGSDAETKASYIHLYNPVTASFAVSPTFGTAPLVVTFTNSSVGDIASRLWQFGDGLTSTLDSPVHTYAGAGTYTPTLSAFGQGGDSSVYYKPGHITVIAEGTLQGRTLAQGRADHSVIAVAAGVHTSTATADGAFALTLPSGSYVVTATLDGYLSARATGVGVGSVTTLEPVRLLGGDADHDGDIDIYDLTLLGASLGTTGVASDINGDGTVNIFDLALAGANFGRVGPSPWP